MYRLLLLLSSVLPDVADAKGVSTCQMELWFLIVMALATSMTVPVVGALLSSPRAPSSSASAVRHSGGAGPRDGNRPRTVPSSRYPERARGLSSAVPASRTAVARGVATGPFGMAESAVDELGTLVEELRPRTRTPRAPRPGRRQRRGGSSGQRAGPATPFDHAAGDQPQQLAAHRYRRRALCTRTVAKCRWSIHRSWAIQTHPQLLDTVITGMFRAGLSLQTAADLPADAVRQRIDAALGDLDDIIRGSQRRIHLPRSPWPAPSCAFRG